MVHCRRDRTPCHIRCRVFTSHRLRSLDSVRSSTSTYFPTTLCLGLSFSLPLPFRGHVQPHVSPVDPRVDSTRHRSGELPPSLGVFDGLRRDLRLRDRI